MHSSRVPPCLLRISCCEYFPISQSSVTAGVLHSMFKPNVYPAQLFPSSRSGTAAQPQSISSPLQSIGTYIIYREYLNQGENVHVWRARVSHDYPPVPEKKMVRGKEIKDHFGVYKRPRVELLMLAIRSWGASTYFRMSMTWWETQNTGVEIET